jgi:hypothetical protein
MKTIVFVYAMLTALAFGSAAQATCNPRVNPHSFDCHHAAFEGMTEFPLKPIDLATLQNEWFATTYAVPGANFGQGFAMDVNPGNPKQPGRGVLNLFPNGFTTVLGSMFIQGDQVFFQNWQNAPMQSMPGSMSFPDEKTVRFTTVDRFGFGHLFVCRDFIRNDIDHLNCQWSIANRFGGWDLAGYMGFLTRSDWDDFVNGRSQHP